MLKKSFTNSKVLKIMLYTLIILGITCFNAFPKSSARYIKEPQDYVLAFENNLINLHENTAFTPEQFSLGSESNYEDFIANLSFKRNNVIFDNTKEIYTIKLAESVKNICEITSITSKDYSTGTPVNIGKIAGNTITYDTPSSPSYNEESTTRIEAFIKCKVNDITIIKGNEKYINLPNIEIKEEIVGEGSFTYLKGGYEEILSKYIAEHPMRDEDLTFEINKIKEGELRNLYEEILNWFDAHYYPYTEYYNEINKYLSNYINESTINIEKLKGLDIDASNLDYYIILLAMPELIILIIICLYIFHLKNQKILMTPLIII